MRYAYDKSCNSPIGVEPHPMAQIISLSGRGEQEHLSLAIMDAEQAQDIMDLIRDAAEINGWALKKRRKR